MTRAHYFFLRITKMGIFSRDDREDIRGGLNERSGLGVFFASLREKYPQKSPWMKCFQCSVPEGLGNRQ
jgi:hypothetical protein